MKTQNLILLFLLTSCSSSNTHYEGYIMNYLNQPVINVKVFEKNNISNFDFTDSLGFFKIKMKKNLISRYLILEEKSKIIDSIQVIGTSGGERINYYFVNGRKDIFYLKK